MKPCIILLVSIVILIIYSSCNEGYINKPLKDEPDDIQFYPCHDKDKLINKQTGEKFDTMGNNNYIIKRHGVSLPAQGVYSYFLDTYKLRNYDEVFHAPICDTNEKSFTSNYSFKHISNLEPPEIIQQEDTMNLNKLLKEEDEFEENSIKDPHYKYVHPEYIGNKITYSDDVNKLFITVHSSHDEENLLHRLDPGLEQSNQENNQ